MNATQTAVNVASLTPVVRLRTFADGALAGRVDRRHTAIEFINANFRHIINRRMKWSTVEPFVREALAQLANLICTKASSRESVQVEINLTTQTMRFATNRRLSYNNVADDLRSDVEELLAAAERVR